VGSQLSPEKMIANRFDRKQNRYDNVWVSLLFLSFVFDRPLFSLFGFWRTDPRPLDFVFFGFLSYILLNPKRLRMRLSTQWYLKWPLLLLLFWFGAIVALQFLWLPAYYQEYSLYYYLRHIQLYIIVWMVATSFLTDEQRIRIMRLFLITVILVSAVGLLQYLGIIGLERRLPSGEIIIMRGSDVSDYNIRINSTLGGHYAYFGGYSVLGIIISIILIASNKVTRVRGWLFMFATISSGLLGVLLSQALSAYGTLIITAGTGCVLVAFFGRERRRLTIGNCNRAIAGKYVTQI
jgi:hypothetical protein